MHAELEELEARIEYRFASRELLLRALTHKSLLSDSSVGPFSPQDDNEQLEFLGDSVLGYIASDYVFRTFPSFSEGRLSKVKSHIVSAACLYEAARAIELGRYLHLGRGEEKSGGRSKRALLADAFEALIAAVYLDGGLETCRAFVEKYLLHSLPLDELGFALLPVDPKSALQELAQSRGLPVPRYVLLREHGPDHAKRFTVEVRVGKVHSAQADGSSKKSAGQLAAGRLLEALTALREEEPIVDDAQAGD